jgi:hypothetical protein
MSSYDKQDPRLGKKGPCTSQEQTAHTKRIKCENLPSLSTPAMVGKSAYNAAKHVASASRIYDRDYSKVKAEPEETDLVTAALGNPLRW